MPAGADPPDLSLFFFFNDTATTEIYTLSLHDALPICHLPLGVAKRQRQLRGREAMLARQRAVAARGGRSEEHTSELQSQSNLVCRLLLEKKKRNRLRHQRRPVGPSLDQIAPPRLEQCR